MNSRSTAPNGPTAQSEQAAPRRKRWLPFVVKTGLGLFILAFIASRLDLDDMVLLKGSPPTQMLGRQMKVAGYWQVQPEKGAPRRIPLSAFPILERRGKTSRIRLEGEPPLYVRAVRLAGQVRLLREGRFEVIPLERVRFQKGARKDGWTEYLPGVKQGLLSIFGRLSLARYALAMLLILGMYVGGVMRWRLLLLAQGLSVSFKRAFQLTFIGFFFNNVVPGLTGGDLVKGVMIARDHPGRGAFAVSTVIVDRVVGILVLAGLSAVVLVFHWSAYQSAALAILIFLGGAAGGIVLFFSRRIRRFFKLHGLLKRLPGASLLMSLDQAFLVYRTRRRALLWAFLISLAAHACNILSIFVMGMDLGVNAQAGLQGRPFVTYLAVVPIILIGSSVPLLPGGWGLGELLYGYFFRTVGVRNLGLSVGLSVLSRFSMLLWSLLGGLYLVTHRREAHEILKEAEELPRES